MTQNLLSHHLDPSSMPLVFQYNKRDLPQVLEIDALDRALNARRVEVIPAVAVRGEGVLETFGTILAQTVQDLASRYAILDIKEGAPPGSGRSRPCSQLFGRTRPLRLDRRPRPPPGRRLPVAPGGGARVHRSSTPGPPTAGDGLRVGAAGLPAPRRARAQRARGEGERPRRDLRRGLRPAGLRPDGAARGADVAVQCLSSTFGRPWRRRRPAAAPARGGARARARAHGPNRGRRQAASGVPRRSAAARGDTPPRWTWTRCSALPRPASRLRKRRAARSRPSPSPRRTSTSGRRSTAPGTVPRPSSPCPSDPRRARRLGVLDYGGHGAAGPEAISTPPRSRVPCPSPSSSRRPPHREGRRARPRSALAGTRLARRPEHLVALGRDAARPAGGDPPPH